MEVIGSDGSCADDNSIELSDEWDMMHRVATTETEKSYRPITLEDVLMLQGQITLKKEFDGLLGVVDDEFWCISSDLENYGLGIYWKLGKPLTEQSEETIDFIHGLLCEK